MSSVLYIIIALLILNVIIIFHEFGHYIVARLCRIDILEFSVGFGPKLLGKTVNGIDYSVRALPLGGYCKFLGEDDTNESANALNNVSVWKRIATIAAGPLMNFIVAYIAAIIMLAVFGAGTTLPCVGQVLPDMPAITAGIEVGDRFVAVNGEEVSFDADGVKRLQNAIRTKDSVLLTVERAGKTLDIELAPVSLYDEALQAERKQIGIVFEFRRLSVAQLPVAGARYMAACSADLLKFFRSLIFRFEGAENVTGVVGTVAIISDTVRDDAKTIWNILFMISLNLGIVNLLPFPGLDGCRLVFLLVEAVRGKPVPPEKEGFVHALGLLLLLGLGILLIWKDLAQLLFRN